MFGNFSVPAEAEVRWIGETGLDRESDLARSSGLASSDVEASFFGVSTASCSAVRNATDAPLSFMHPLASSDIGKSSSTMLSTTQALFVPPKGIGHDSIADRSIDLIPQLRSPIPEEDLVKLQSSDAAEMTASEHGQQDDTPNDDLAFELPLVAYLLKEKIPKRGRPRKTSLPSTLSSGVGTATSLPPDASGEREEKRKRGRPPKRPEDRKIQSRKSTRSRGRPRKAFAHPLSIDAVPSNASNFFLCLSVRPQVRIHSIAMEADRVRPSLARTIPNPRTFLPVLSRPQVRNRIVPRIMAIYLQNVHDTHCSSPSDVTAVSLRLGCSRQSSIGILANVALGARYRNRGLVRGISASSVTRAPAIVDPVPRFSLHQFALGLACQMARGFAPWCEGTTEARRLGNPASKLNSFSNLLSLLLGYHDHRFGQPRRLLCSEDFYTPASTPLGRENILASIIQTQHPVEFFATEHRGSRNRLQSPKRRRCDNHEMDNAFCGHRTRSVLSHMRIDLSGLRSSKEQKSEPFTPDPISQLQKRAGEGPKQANGKRDSSDDCAVNMVARVTPTGQDHGFALQNACHDVPGKRVPTKSSKRSKHTIHRRRGNCEDNRFAKSVKDVLSEAFSPPKFEAAPIRSTTGSMRLNLAIFCPHVATMGEGARGEFQEECHAADPFAVVDGLTEPPGSLTTESEGDIITNHQRVNLSAVRPGPIAEWDSRGSKRNSVLDTLSQNLTPAPGVGTRTTADTTRSQFASSLLHTKLLPRGVFGRHPSSTVTPSTARLLPSVFPGHGLTRFSSFPITLIGGFTVRDRVSLLAQTRAVAKQLSCRIALKSNDTFKECSSGPLTRLAAQVEQRALVRKDMLTGLLGVVSSGKLFGDTLHAGVSALQEVVKEQTQYTRGLNLPKQSTDDTVGVFWGEQENFRESLCAFPRKVPHCLLPISDIALERAHDRLCGVHDIVPVGAPDGLLDKSTSTRYTTLHDGIPFAPWINIEHTYQWCGSFVPYPTPAESACATATLEPAHACQVHASAGAGNNTVVVDVPVTLPVRQERDKVLPPPFIALNPAGDLHRLTHRRFGGWNWKDAVGRVDADAVVREVSHVDEEVPSSTPTPNESVQPDTNNDMSAIKASFSTFPTFERDGSKTLPSFARKSGSAIDIDTVLRRGENCISRIPMPDVECRYGPLN